MDDENTTAEIDHAAIRGALLLTIPEAAKRLAIGRSTAYELIARGQLRSVHIGRCHRVPVDALSELVDLLDHGDNEGEPISYW